ncbi:N-acetylglucosaminyl deacetylase, LmbE family [Marinobacter persicus]|uniref:N-acetylglucosaminyl deacetylase, LmbE family n=1 Tax=Marinobacter persicus TaxID=930118 RepID=A0A1I3PAU6_9GAMM|nr:PIG-L deacetylase family protein [Marinobacter persicus]SFJ18467.1 N-acetylglucosaminyl deacetylase, LmbE family [Marinobacter persicus]
MRNINRCLVIAPHPDDETLGCGGTILKLKAQGVAVHWLIVTTIEGVSGFSQERVPARAREIAAVREAYGFDGVHHCSLPAAALDTISKGELVGAIGNTVKSVNPGSLYIPYRNDVHSDHTAVFDAAVSAAKTFRSPSVRAIYAYETLSETDFCLRPGDSGFRPNLYENITGYLDKKIDIMSLFEGEMGKFPFPRSEECLRALATLRGAQANCLAAEAFMTLKEIR